MVEMYLILVVSVEDLLCFTLPVPGVHFLVADVFFPECSKVVIVAIGRSEVAEVPSAHSILEDRQQCVRYFREFVIQVVHLLGRRIRYCKCCDQVNV